MQSNFYTSTEAGQITGCSRRQLQYWRDKGVIVPTVNPSGKGRNVYYSVGELLALTVMNNLLSLGLSFDLCVSLLDKLKSQESWLFSGSLEPIHRKRWIILLSPEFPHPKLIDFDGESKTESLTLKAIEQGGGAIGLGSDRIYQQLSVKLDLIRSRAKRSAERGSEAIACMTNSDS